MSTLYEQWQPSVGDRVRIVMRDETGKATDSGQTGTVVSIRPGEANTLCEVEYDPRPDANPPEAPRTHAASDLVPIEQPARVTVRTEPEPNPPADPGPAWRPSVGDRVAIGDLNRGGTISAVEERGDDTICEVEYDHRPGEPAEPQRRHHSVCELTPIKDPSAAVL